MLAFSTASGRTLVHVPLVGRPKALDRMGFGNLGVSVTGFENDLVRAAVTAEMDDLGLVFVELAQQVDRPCTGDQDQLDRAAETCSGGLPHRSRGTRGGDRAAASHVGSRRRAGP